MFEMMLNGFYAQLEALCRQGRACRGQPRFQGGFRVWLCFVDNMLGDLRGVFMFLRRRMYRWRGDGDWRGDWRRNGRFEPCAACLREHFLFIFFYGGGMHGIDSGLFHDDLPFPVYVIYALFCYYYIKGKGEWCLNTGFIFTLYMQITSWGMLFIANGETCPAVAYKFLWSLKLLPRSPPWGRCRRNRRFPLGDRGGEKNRELLYSLFFMWHYF